METKIHIMTGQYIISEWEKAKAAVDKVRDRRWTIAECLPSYYDIEWNGHNSCAFGLKDAPLGFSAGRLDGKWKFYKKNPHASYSNID